MGMHGSNSEITENLLKTIDWPCFSMTILPWLFPSKASLNYRAVFWHWPNMKLNKKKQSKKKDYKPSGKCSKDGQLQSRMVLSTEALHTVRTKSEELIKYSGMNMMTFAVILYAVLLSVCWSDTLVFVRCLLQYGWLRQCCRYAIVDRPVTCRFSSVSIWGWMTVIESIRTVFSYFWRSLATVVGTFSRSVDSRLFSKLTFIEALAVAGFGACATLAPGIISGCWLSDCKALARVFTQCDAGKWPYPVYPAEHRRSEIYETTCTLGCRKAMDAACLLIVEKADAMKLRYTLLFPVRSSCVGAGSVPPIVGG